MRTTFRALVGFVVLLLVTIGLGFGGFQMVKGRMDANKSSGGRGGGFFGAQEHDWISLYICISFDILRSLCLSLSIHMGPSDYIHILRVRKRRIQNGAPKIHGPPPLTFIRICASILVPGRHRLIQ